MILISTGGGAYVKYKEKMLEEKNVYILYRLFSHTLYFENEKEKKENTAIIYERSKNIVKIKNL